MIKTLEITASFLIEEKKERMVFRFFEILPGLISLLTLFFALFFSFLKPVWLAIFIIIFSLYWCLRTFYLTFLQILSFFKIKKNLQTDWQKKIEIFPESKKIYHLVIVAVYRENELILQRTLKSILDSHFSKERIIVLITFEEKERERNEKTKKILEKVFEKKLPHLFFNFHKLKEDEIAGRGSNINSAIEFARKETLPLLKIPEENVLCSHFDSDTVVFPHYFNVLTYAYLKENDYKRAFQPIPLYNNNILSTSFLARLCAFCSSFWQMMQQEKGEDFATFSSHAVPLKVLNEIGGYPKNVVPDDSHLFWKALLFYNGDFKVVPLNYPVSMDVVAGENFISSLKSLYSQQKRWAWGVTEFPFVAFQVRKNKKIPLLKKIFYCFSLFEAFWSWATASLLIFFLGWLPLIFGGQEFNATILAFNLPHLTRGLMTLATVGMIVSGIINFSFLTSPFSKAKIPFSSKIKNFFQWFLLPVVLILFGCLPALDAQIRLMLGKTLHFKATEKYYVA